MDLDHHHCYLCFVTLEHHLATKNLGSNHKEASVCTQLLDKLSAVLPAKDQLYPLFVTWKVTEDHRLRGCIGTFQATAPLQQLLPEYALIAAMQDSRFYPISRGELNDLHVTVSLLYNFETVDQWDDWEVGTHGIRVRFKKRYSATFLPEVAHEQGWTKRQTIERAIEKAGYNGAIPEEVFTSESSLVQVERYQSRTKSVSYQEYMAWKSNHQIEN
ncbi:hypothetical protein MIR68_007257 [Amoeboaphelidium protococcarum]|nr:hypothetical protein MIR68_007257 [Amoeboaphelidium protococcarum]